MLWLFAVRPSQIDCGIHTTLTSMNKEGVVGTHAGPVDCREKNTLIVVLEFLLRSLIMLIPFYLSFLVPSLHLCFNESVYV